MPSGYDVLPATAIFQLNQRSTTISFTLLFHLLILPVMGKLVKSHWARLVVLVAAAIQIGGSIEGYFWPKVTWDFLTTALDFLVVPIPALQTINLLLGLVVVAGEWPLSAIAGKMYHRSIHARLVMYTICAISALFLYQSHTSALYYILGIYAYIAALYEHEVSFPQR
jgi:hypothetical protein